MGMRMEMGMESEWDGDGDGGWEQPIPDQAIKVHHRDRTGRGQSQGQWEVCSWA